MNAWYATAIFAVPTLLYFFVCYRVTQWLARRIVEPFIDKHMVMMQQLGTAYLAQTDSLREIKDSLNRLETIFVCRYPGDGRRKTPTTLPGAVLETKG